MAAAAGAGYAAAMSAEGAAAAHLLAAACGAIDAYYAENPGLVTQSADSSEVKSCVQFALGKLAEFTAKESDSVIYKKKAFPAVLSRSVIIQKKGNIYNIGIISKRLLGKGSYKKAKDLLSVEIGLDTGSVAILSKALCIRLLDINVKGPKRAEYIKRKKIVAKREIDSHKELAAVKEVIALENTLFRRVESKFFAEPVIKVYNVYPRAALGTLEKFISSTRKIGSYIGIDTFKQTIVAFACASRALAIVHAKGDVYCDFKTDNILGFSVDDWRLGDLESVMKVEEYKTSPESIISSKLFAPPESFVYILSKIKAKAPEDPRGHDVWALGLSILMAAANTGDEATEATDDEFCLALGVDPKLCKTNDDMWAFLAARTPAQVENAINFAIRMQPRIEPFREILRQMLHLDPRARLSMDRARDALMAYAATL